MSEAIGARETGAAIFDATRAREVAERYERTFVPAIGRPVATRLVAAAALRPGERVLDVACGTGIVTRLAAGRVGPEGSVAGLDPNPAMLAVAREVAPADAPFAWHQAPAERMPLEEGAFDVVLCGMGLQFFGDRAAGLREMRRVLVPGGRLAANVPGPTPPPLRAMEEALGRHVGTESARFLDTVFRLHDADELRALAAEAGFDDAEIRSEVVPLELGRPAAFLWDYVGSTPIAASVARLDESARGAFERDFVEACEPFLADGVLRGAVRMTTVTAVR